jgi:5'-nucleotidase/UDP-sugar diphosphatase
MEPDMRKLILGGVVIVGAAVVGCQQQAQKPAQTSSMRPAALDVSSPAVSSTPTYQPAPLTPPPSEPAPAQSSASASTANYTVKKGDTLYRIAKDRYGDGKQWQKIASANPGVSPSTLRVGQTLTLPQ